jgi:hypothetical protein
LKAEITEGLLWVWREPFLRAAVGVIGGINLVFNALTLVLIVRAKQLGASPALIGVMFAFVGAGGLLGSFVAPWVRRSFGARRVVVTVGWLWVAQIGVLAVLPNAALAENLIRARQAACSCSWRIPPRRWRLRMSRWAIWSRSMIGGGSGRSGRALAMP